MHRIVVLDDYQGQFSDFADWSALGSDVEVIFVRTHVEGTELLAILEGAEVIVAMRERTPLPREVIEKLPDLRHIVTAGSQNAAIDMVAAKEHGVVVSGTPANDPAVTELSWALILAAVKHVVREDRAMRAGIWQETISGDLAGKTLGIAGLGRLGSTMVPFAKLFQMDVIAWSQNLDSAYAESLGVTAVTKEELLARSDVITIHLKLSARTEGLFGENEFARMKPTAYLINTSRGPIVQEAALISALSSDTIAGAGLDVFDEEPMPPDHPLFSLANVVLTPHLGYATENRLRGWFVRIVENISAHLAGAPINVLGSEASSS